MEFSPSGSPLTLFSVWLVLAVSLYGCVAGPAPPARIRSSGSASGSHQNVRDVPESRQYYDILGCFQNCISNNYWPQCASTTTTTWPWWYYTTTYTTADGATTSAPTTGSWTTTAEPVTTVTPASTTTDTTTTTTGTTSTATTPVGRRKKRAYETCPDWVINNCITSCQNSITTAWPPTTTASWYVPPTGWGGEPTTTSYQWGHGWGATTPEPGFSMDIVKFIQSLGQKGSKLYNFFRMNTWGGFVEYSVPVPIDVDRAIEANPVVDCASIAELLTKYGAKRNVHSRPEPAPLPPIITIPETPTTPVAPVFELPIIPTLTPIPFVHPEVSVVSPDPMTVSGIHVMPSAGAIELPTASQNGYTAREPQLSVPMLVIPVAELTKLIELYGATVVGDNVLVPTAPTMTQFPVLINAIQSGGSTGQIVSTEICTPTALGMTSPNKLVATATYPLSPPPITSNVPPPLALNVPPSLFLDMVPLLHDPAPPMPYNVVPPNVLSPSLHVPPLTEPDTPSPDAFADSPSSAPVISLDEDTSSTSTITLDMASPTRPTSSLSRKRSRQNSAEVSDHDESTQSSEGGWVKHFEAEDFRQDTVPVTELPTVTLISRNEKSLSDPFPSRADGIELKVLKQPETHHRARYRTEGSRGCIKDRSRTQCPQVQLTGFSGPGGLLLVFLASESGPVHPHTIYRAIRAGGKRATGSSYLKFGSVDVLQMELNAAHQWTVKVDNLGIMKLRNTDLDGHCPRPPIKGCGARGKRSRKVRLAFRALLPLPNGKILTLQTVSTQICCSAAPGQPEIIHLSHTECSAVGGLQLVVLGKNFLKDETESKVWITEKSEEDDVIWEAPLLPKGEYYHNSHIVGVVPPYRSVGISKPVTVWITVRNRNGRESDPVAFCYVPTSSARDGKSSFYESQRNLFKPARSEKENLSVFLEDSHTTDVGSLGTEEVSVPESMTIDCSNPTVNNGFYPLDFLQTTDNIQTEQIFSELWAEIFGSVGLPDGSQQMVSGLGEVSLAD